MDVWPSQAQQEEKASRSAVPGAEPLNRYSAAQKASGRLGQMPAWQRSKAAHYHLAEQPLLQSSHCLIAATVTECGQVYQTLPGGHQSRPLNSMPPRCRAATTKQAVRMWECVPELSSRQLTHCSCDPAVRSSYSRTSRPRRRCRPPRTHTCTMDLWGPGRRACSQGAHTPAAPTWAVPWWLARCSSTFSCRERSSRPRQGARSLRGPAVAARVHRRVSLC